MSFLQFCIERPPKTHYFVFCERRNAIIQYAAATAEIPVAEMITCNSLKSLPAIAENNSTANRKPVGGTIAPASHLASGALIGR